MATEQLIPYAMQHVVTGMVLYTLYATRNAIDDANRNLQVNGNFYRFIQIDGPAKPLPPPRS
jgi:hypothetical protein